ncbi:uncharacterized protein PG998_002433 [Apiospora kogelbergensis]|uniref:CST complex subunit Ten1 n=1 Tax=Apiospora kogelbergensis TaxID=1337665 RepID=A0AAW0QGD4_9PEZI
MSYGPVPSRRCLLSRLPQYEVRDKVRFLGCVTSYATASGILILEHSHSQDSHVKVHLDVKLLLQSLNREQTDVGQWVHVIGYISFIQRPSSKAPGLNHSRVDVQALVLWKAEDLDLPSYEASFRDAI